MSKKNHLFCHSIRPVSRQPLATLRLALLPCLVIMACTVQAQTDSSIQVPAPEENKAEPVQVAALSTTDSLGFNMAFLQGNASTADLRTLLSNSNVSEGVQRVDLYVNQQRTGRRDITFKRNPRTDDNEPCFNQEMLEQAGVDLSKLPAPLPAEASCLRLPEIVPEATVTYESAQLRLQLNIPQIYLSPSKRGYVDPSLWDSGQMAAFVNYGLNVRRDQSKGMSATNDLSADLRMGVNIGPWRLRNNSYYSSGTNRPSSFTSQNTYAQRDIVALKSQLLAGQTYTRSPLFDSVRFMGVQMLSDEAMRPDSEQGYAPVIRGTAESNATVEVRQNGYVIYTTNVAPGPFAISDLSPSGSNGDLEITIIEADGSRRILRQAFSAPPLMVREGRLSYDIAAGQLRLNDNMQERPHFVSGSMLYGVSANTTLAAGVQASKNFSAYSLGVGMNTQLGAVSLDATRSTSHIQGQQSQGTSMNLRYNKFIETTGSNVSVNLRHDLSRGYRTLSDHVQAMEAPAHLRMYGSRDSRQRIDANISQPVGDGNLYLNASYNKHWENTSSNSLSVGYSNNIGKVSYNLAYTRTRNLQSSFSSSRSHDNAIMLTLSMPLGSGSHAPQSFTSINHDNNGNSVQAGASGLLPTDREISYAVAGGRTVAGESNASVNVGTTTSFARMNAGYSYGNRHNSGNFSANGSIVAHGGGVNLGQALGETIMLAKVEPAVAGVGISSHVGVETGSNGYAIIPNATPYRSNHVSLDTRKAPKNAEFDNAVQQIVPTRGAVALATFKAEVGYRVQFELRDEQGLALPFGAMVRNAAGEQLGMTDPRGRVLTMVSPEQMRGHLDISRDGQLCRARYELSENTDELNYQLVRLNCVQRDPDPMLPGDLAKQGKDQDGTV
ncbi:fimbria/pilus outer membrane usher protein [Alcaligenes phenolicus]|uniref:fimbria/pilus outer membrane usher protein n=1 Tax=Alcaligenes sp. 1735tsa3 TaxID=2953809 RepID=UPI0020A76C8C|nr:fimbria/pilus outer membrane usher protein [Alcaligenes sp. 1735tsa3]USY24511.1 fimbrial biogenesis outer membrane usher protein [Alcaligenes sp. 1735tsa3]